MGLKKNNPGCKCCLIGTPPDCDCRRRFFTAPVGTPLPSRFMPTEYTISVAGLTNDNCTSCDDWNGDFSLCWCESCHTWHSEPDTSTACGHNNGDPLWELEYTGTFYKLTALGINLSWSLTPSSWIAFETNTLAANTPPSPNPCGGIPSTIDIEPCMAACTGCGNPAPQSVSVTLAGWTGYQCLCDDINDTFILHGGGGTGGWPCNYSANADIGCGPGTWISNWLKVIASVSQYPLVNAPNNNLGWFVQTEYNIQYFGYPYIPTPIQGIIRGWWWWDSGDVVDFDCTASHSLTLIREWYTFTNRPCGVLGSTTCQIN